MLNELEHRSGRRDRKMIRKNAFQPDSRILAAFTAMVLIGGTNFVAVRLSDRGLAPLYGAGLRFLGAAVLLYMFLIVRRIALPTREQLKGTLLYGALGFAASYAFAYRSEERRVGKECR